MSSAVQARVPVLTMAFAAGAAVSNIYYCQPMLGIMARTFDDASAIGFIPTATQLGYGLGMFVMVPLGDLFERRRIIVLQFLGLAVAMAVAALAPSPILLLAASLLVGIAASVTQQVVPLAAHLAPESKRGAVVGTVMAGLLCGILLSRTLSGFVGQHLGFRAMFWLAAPMALVLAALMQARLPESKPTTTMRYRTLMLSLVEIWRAYPTLRRATYTQALLFGAFSAFWTTLAFLLEEPRFSMGAAVAGLFGVIGAIGVLAAPIAGRVADRRGPQLVIGVGTVAAALSWLLLGAWPTFVGLVAGVVLLDFAVQGCLISHQTIIYALQPDARSRINTLFMGGMFSGGAAGSAAAAALYRTHGWSGVSALAIGLTLLAAALQIRATVRRPAAI